MRLQRSKTTVTTKLNVVLFILIDVQCQDVSHRFFFRFADKFWSARKHSPNLTRRFVHTNDDAPSVWLERRKVSRSVPGKGRLAKVQAMKRANNMAGRRSDAAQIGWLEIAALLSV
ncbi:MAG: hypothetical protein H6875_09295 [Hyphomicrobiaceae bacterium]|nr:hypothetical protein [Hyphomicrobiaceae bacterium]